MCYLTVLLIASAIGNGVYTEKILNKRNMNDSFAINIGAGYGFGIEQISSGLPKSTTKINHSTNYISTPLRDDVITVNHNIGGNPNSFYSTTPRTLETQESIKKIVSRKPHHSNGWKTSSSYRAKSIMNMKDIEKILHNLDDDSEYSKVLQVVKSPAIYEIHSEKQKNTRQTSDNFLKTAPYGNIHTSSRMNNQKQALKTKKTHGDIIYGNAKAESSNFPQISNWMNENYYLREDGNGKSILEKYSASPSKQTLSPFIAAGDVTSNIEKPGELNRITHYSYRTNSNAPSILSRGSQRNLRQMKNSNSNAPRDLNPYAESTRNYYEILPLNQPQAMYEVAAPALGQSLTYQNEPQAKTVASYSTLSPVLPYDLMPNHSPRLFRNVHRSGNFQEDTVYKNQRSDYIGETSRVSCNDALDVSIAPSKDAVISTSGNQEADERFPISNIELNGNGRGKFSSYQVHESIIDNIYLTTDRPDRKTYNVFREPKGMLGEMLKTTMNRRSGDPMKYFLYVNEKYSDEYK